MKHEFNLKGTVTGRLPAALPDVKDISRIPRTFTSNVTVQASNAEAVHAAMDFSRFEEDFARELGVPLR